MVRAFTSGLWNQRLETFSSPLSRSSLGSQLALGLQLASCAAAVLGKALDPRPEAASPSLSPPRLGWKHSVLPPWSACCQGGLWWGSSHGAGGC